jgi:hypothetical protein
MFLNRPFFRSAQENFAGFGSAYILKLRVSPVEKSQVHVDQPLYSGGPSLHTDEHSAAQSNLPVTKSINRMNTPKTTVFFVAIFLSSVGTCRSR